MIIGCSTIHALFCFYFLANGLTNLDVLWHKTFLIPREIIPQNFSSSGLVILEELGNKQTDRLTHSLTDIIFLL